MKDEKQELEERRTHTALIVNLVTIVCPLAIAVHLIKYGTALPAAGEATPLGMAAGLAAWLWWRDFGRYGMGDPDGD